MKLFGWSFGFRNKQKPISPNDQIRGAQVQPDMVLTATAGGTIQHSAAVQLVFEEDRKLIELYRRLHMDAWVRDAVDDIVNEAVDEDELTGNIVSLDLKKTKNLSDGVKKKIEAEFETILSLLNFNNTAEELFREWYIDGRHFFYLIPHSNPRLGLKEIRKVDSLYIKRVLKIIYDPERTIEENTHNPKTELCYFYTRPTDEELSRNRNGAIGFTAAHIKTSDNSLFEIKQDAIAYSDSGELNVQRQLVSKLHQAIKPFNQLSMMEDSTIIYSLSRAPERRIWYIGTGDLSPKVAEQFVKDLMRKYTHTDVYNSETGLTSDRYEIRSVVEDIWIPRSSNEGKNTEVETLESGKALQDKMEHVDWFKEKLYTSLCIPISRLKSDTNFQFGKTAEITRDEVNFSKFINGLRRRFSEALLDMLKKQLILRKIVTEEEWNQVRTNAKVNWHGVSYFREIKSLELWDIRLNMLDRMSSIVGTYVDKDFVWNNIMKFDQTQIEKIKKGIERDAAAGEVVPIPGAMPGNDSIDSEYSDGITAGNPVDKVPVDDIPKQPAGDEEIPSDEELSSDSGEFDSEDQDESDSPDDPKDSQQEQDVTSDLEDDENESEKSK